MTQPSVNVTEIDGALGILPPSAGKILAVAGTSSSGTVDTPVAFARVSDVVAYFGTGPLVEAMCHEIEVYGRPVLGVRATAGTAGTFVAGSGAAALNDDDWTGTSVLTLSGTPTDDFEIVFEIVAGGTIGTAGITYRVSYDGGRNWEPTSALGVAVSVTLAGSILAFAAGTAVAGDVAQWTTAAPACTSTNITSALEALRLSNQPWGIVELACPVENTIHDATETKMAAMFAMGKPRAWIGGFRMPNRYLGANDDETEAEYLTAFDAAFASNATIFGTVCAGAVKMISSVSGRAYRRPFGFIVAARTASVSEEVNIADVNLGPLPCSIRDVNGNPDEHDESINPGLDDSRACVARTWEGLQGVYVNRPLLLSPAGSDFDIMPKRRVMNLAHEALRVFFLRRLNVPVLVSPTTGYILESEALEIEAGARAAMKAVLGAKPKASSWSFVLSRTDNLLSTKTLNGQARIVPLAYPETIEIEIGFQNPALQVQAA